MPNEETTTKFKVDISELKKSMQDAKREISIANSEFKAVSSSMDDWSKSTDGISAKLKQLDSNLKSQKTILNSLEQQYEAVKQEQGEGSAAADKLKIAINNQKAVINQTEKQIGQYETALVETSKAEKVAAATGKEVVVVLEDMSGKTKDAGDGFTAFKATIATFAGNMITGFVNSIKNGISNIISLADETREYRTEMAKLDTAFTTNGHSAETAQSTYKSLYAVLGDEGQAVEAANHLAKLTQSEEDLANWTNIAAGVYGTFGASLPIEGLTEAANETAKVGQVTGPLADALNWAGISEDKFNESLAACNSEQERQELIMNTLNGLYGEAANKFKETNSSVMEANNAQATLTDAMAKLGEITEPIITTVKQGFADILTKALELIEGVDFSAIGETIKNGFQNFIDNILPKIVDGFQWVIENKDILIAGLAGIAAGFVAFNVANMIMGVVNAFKAFKAANEGATIAQWLMNAAMNANPIMLIVTLVAALITAIVTFIATNDDARAKIVAAWEAVKQFVGTAIEAIKNFFVVTIPQALETMINWFKELPGKIWTWLSNVIAKVGEWASNMLSKAKEMGSDFINSVVNFFAELPGKIWTWLTNVILKIATWQSNMVSKAKEAATNFVNNVVDFVKELPGKIWTWLADVVSKVGAWAGNLAAKGREAAQKLLTSIVDKVKEIPGKMLEMGKNIVQGLWDGIGNAVDWLKGKIKEFVGNVTSWLKKFFEIGSPSKLMRDEIGKWIPRGIAVGIQQSAKYAIEALDEMSSEMLESEKHYIAEKERLEKEASEKEWAEKMANAKDAEELEKIKQEKIAKEQKTAQDAYLASLEETAKKEREEYDAWINDLKSKFEEIQKSQDGFSSKLLSDTQKTLNTITIQDGKNTITHKVLADTSDQISKLENYSTMLDSLIEKRGVLPEDIKTILSGMGADEGMEYMQAMLNATDAEWENYAANFDKRKTLSDKIAETLFPADSIKGAENIFGQLQTETQSAVEGVQTEFLGTLKDNVTTAIDTATEKLKEAVKSLKDNLNETISTLNTAELSGSNLASLAGGGVGYSYTQIINSPKQLSRLDIYRNTKNLLGFAGGGN